MVRKAHPKLLNKWDIEKTTGLLRFNLEQQAIKKDFRYPKTDHPWKAAIVSRNHVGKNFPYCESQRICPERKELTIRFPALLLEWHPMITKGNLTTTAALTHHSVWWECFHCKHEWKATITNQTNRNSYCPNCAQKK